MEGRWMRRRGKKVGSRCEGRGEVLMVVVYVLGTCHVLLNNERLRSLGMGRCGGPRMDGSGGCLNVS